MILSKDVKALDFAQKDMFRCLKYIATEKKLFEFKCSSLLNTYLFLKIKFVIK